MLHAQIEWDASHPEGVRFVAATGSGHTLVMDDAVGRTGPKPVELVAAAVGGCTAFDVINILRKKRKHVSSYHVSVEAEQAGEPPKVFTEVRIHHTLSGSDLDSKSVADAIHLSESKYCSVGAMIEKTAHIRSTFEILADRSAPTPLIAVH